MTRRRILFINTDGKQYLTAEYNGDKSELESFHSTDSCEKKWEDIEAEFRLCNTLDEFNETDKRSQAYYHSSLGANEYVPADELEVINRSYSGSIITIAAEHPTHIIFGDYVFTPEKNAFNGKTSWWISKPGYAVALYCFTADTPREARYQLEESARNGYIKMFEDSKAAALASNLSAEDIRFIRYLTQYRLSQMRGNDVNVYSGSKTEEAELCERLLAKTNISEDSHNRAAKPCSLCRIEKQCGTCKNNCTPPFDGPCADCSPGNGMSGYQPVNFCPNCGRPLSAKKYDTLQNK